MAEEKDATNPKEEAAKSGKGVIKPRDRWDKLDILLKPLGGLFTGIALAAVGYFTTDALEKQQAKDADNRLYTEIMSSREQKDSDLRKEMLNSIINAFLDDKNKKQLDEKVLALELLAYNFHDVIDLSPLFKHVAMRIEESELEDKKKEKLKSQLRRVASEVIAKQLATLGEGGIIVPLSVKFEKMKKDGLQELDERLYPMRVDSPDPPGQRFILVEAQQIFPKEREIRVRLEIGDSRNRFEPELDIAFKVGFFDFPMIDNTRVSHSQRIGVALTRWTDDNGAELTLVYFPGSRASLKEKPYYDELIEQLRRTTISQKDEGE
ncbi:hypothetical protein [Kaarinaea lacus]